MINRLLDNVDISVQRSILRKCCNKLTPLRCLFIIVCLISRYMISSYADRQNDKYISIRKVADFISNLKQDTNKLDFIHNHLFNFNKSDFEDFVKGVINKYNIYRLSINKNKLNIGAVAKDTFTIKALFWHDAFIFDLIEAIHSFNSGFAKVLEVNITKIATNTEESPAIEAEITCIVFCSK